MDTNKIDEVNVLNLLVEPRIYVLTIAFIAQLSSKKQLEKLGGGGSE